MGILVCKSRNKLMFYIRRFLSWGRGHFVILQENIYVKKQEKEKEAAKCSFLSAKY